MYNLSMISLDDFPAQWHFRTEPPLKEKNSPFRCDSSASQGVKTSPDLEAAKNKLPDSSRTLATLPPS